MSTAIPGLHHVTAICGPPQENVDFYVQRLGQRLVKKTVNFDAPDTYHLYYADHVGSPGTVMTFFPFVNAGPGRAGPGSASAVAYALSPGGVDAWMHRLADAGTDFDGPSERFGERMIALTDPHGMMVELIESTSMPAANTAASIDADHDTLGFHSVTLWVAEATRTARVLTELFGYQPAGEEQQGDVVRHRFIAPSGGIASVVDIIVGGAQQNARQGAGSIHHVAFRAQTPEMQREWRERIQEFGLQVTPVIDRQYFEAIYFNEPGGILFEIATDPPGFAVDEPEDELGTHLLLPPQHEPRRASLERTLPEIRVPA